MLYSLKAVVNLVIESVFPLQYHLQKVILPKFEEIVTILSFLPNLFCQLVINNNGSNAVYMHNGSRVLNKLWEYGKIRIFILNSFACAKLKIYFVFYNLRNPFY